MATEHTTLHNWHQLHAKAERILNGSLKSGWQGIGVGSLDGDPQTYINNQFDTDLECIENPGDHASEIWGPWGAQWKSIWPDSGLQEFCVVVNRAILGYLFLKQQLQQQRQQQKQQLLQHKQLQQQQQQQQRRGCWRSLMTRRKVEQQQGQQQGQQQEQQQEQQRTEWM